MPARMRGRMWRAFALTAVSLLVVPSAILAYTTSKYECPKLRLTKQILGLAVDGSRDVYGTRIRIDRHPAYVLAVSAGEDTQFDTVDDIVVLSGPR